MPRTKLPAFNAVSEWLAATAEILVNDPLALKPASKAARKLEDQFQMVYGSQIERETDKAIGLKGIRWNACANAKPAIVWLPKSQLRQLINDCLTQCGDQIFLVPTWLINAKNADGYELT